jgi:hypothetical protein
LLKVVLNENRLSAEKKEKLKEKKKIDEWLAGKKHLGGGFCSQL